MQIYQTNVNIDLGILITIPDTRRIVGILNKQKFWVTNCYNRVILIAAQSNSCTRKGDRESSRRNPFFKETNSEIYPLNSAWNITVLCLYTTHKCMVKAIKLQSLLYKKKLNRSIRKVEEYHPCSSLRPSYKYILNMYIRLFMYFLLNISFVLVWRQHPLSLFWRNVAVL